jgi:pentapeptide MXKDX repeat protein
MRSIPLLLRTVALGILLGALPVAVHAQSADRNTKPAMGAMKDTAAMKHDATMGKDAMAKDGMSHDAMSKDTVHAKDAMKHKEAAEVKKADKMKSTGAKSDKGAMAEPAKMSQP